MTLMTLMTHFCILLDIDAFSLSFACAGVKKRHVSMYRGRENCDMCDMSDMVKLFMIKLHPSAGIIAPGVYYDSGFPEILC
jgi:hypothetical protein